jgi:hypothetical protein
MQGSACIIQSNGLGKHAAKGAGQHAGNERCKSWCLLDWAAGRKKNKIRGAVRGRESRQPNVSPVSLRNVSSEYRVRHAASKGRGSAGRQQRVPELSGQKCQHFNIFQRHLSDQGGAGWTWNSAPLPQR